MTEIDREIVREDLEFVCEYIGAMLDRHPELLKEDPNFIRKIDRRFNDILKRTGA